MTSQMRRSAISIPSNIAEGYGRNSKNDFARFLMIPKGSACELETQLLLASNIGYLDKEETDSILAVIVEIKSMIHVFAQKLRSRD